MILYDIKQYTTRIKSVVLFFSQMIHSYLRNKLPSKFFRVFIFHLNVQMYGSPRVLALHPFVEGIYKRTLGNLCENDKVGLQSGLVYIINVMCMHLFVVYLIYVA